MVETRSQKRLKLNEEDYISRLANDVLLQILLKLNVLEAARTSLLSSRWVNLWTFNSTCLSIDEKDSRTSSDRFVKTVTLILSKHRAQTLDQLNIIYPRDPSETCKDSHKVDSWINIVAQKQVKALKLVFNRCKINPSPSLSLGSTTFSSLLTLSLNHAPLTCKLIESVLLTSPNLKELSIVRAGGLLNHLRISGVSLKRLELHDNDIESLELSAPKLESFNFRSWRTAGTKICFQHVPLLTQLSYFEYVMSNVRRDYYTILPQLETLTFAQIRLSLMDAVVPSCPPLKNLKQMHVTLNMNAPSCMFWPLFRASPSLCRLSLDLRTTLLSNVNQALISEYSDHMFLKEVEVDAFCGSEGEIKLLIWVARSSPSLERIIVHPSPYKDGKLLAIIQKRIPKAIEQLRSRLPQVKILLDVTNHLRTWMPTTVEE